MKIGFLNLLTVIFVIAKLANVINWSWWLVFSPTIVSVALVILFLILSLWAYSIPTRKRW